MESLYLKDFGLAREPFNITPDPRFLFLSDSHKEALAQLVYGIKARKGFVVLTGEVGTGKTTLINRLVDELNGTTKTAIVFNMIVGPQDLLRYVCEKFGLICNGDGHKGVHDYIVLLEQFLRDSYQQGQNVALIIDEAQNLSSEVLENVRLLSNFETEQDKLLQILLVGQPELGNRLNGVDVRQIKQRVALRYRLSPLSIADCEKYVAKRLEIAGGSMALFSTGAIAAVHNYSTGIPRLINVLCDNGLLAAYALRKNHVDEGMIEEIALDLELSDLRQSPAIANESPVTTDGASYLTAREIKTRLADVQGHTDAAEAMAKPAAKRMQFSNGRSWVEPLNRPNISTLSPPTAPAQVARLTGATTDIVPARFFDNVVVALTDAIGPMASIVLHDHVAAMGEAMEAFPKWRLFDLVHHVSREILSDALSINFLRVMGDEITALKADGTDALPRSPASMSGTPIK